MYFIGCLLGSVARGEQREGSDVDTCVEIFILKCG
ncbi:nucleotidyltransferase domain-containing protein [Bacteroides xylanisolvens]